jgi:hypothetical protein
VATRNEKVGGNNKDVSGSLIINGHILVLSPKTAEASDGELYCCWLALFVVLARG